MKIIVFLILSYQFKRDAKESTLLLKLKIRELTSGVFLGYFLLGMCRWPPRAPTPLLIVWSVANDRPHLYHFWANCNFRDS